MIMCSVLQYRGQLHRRHHHCHSLYEMGQVHRFYLNNNNNNNNNNSGSDSDSDSDSNRNNVLTCGYFIST